MKPKLINKKHKKLIDRKCAFCDCDRYELLDVHRIVPGEQGGKYTEYNTLSLCASCHRKVHAEIIKILGKHFSSSGRYLVHYIEDGVEKWV